VSDGDVSSDGSRRRLPDGRRSVRRELIAVPAERRSPSRWAALDARLLTAVLLRGGVVAEWLNARGVALHDVLSAFPDSDR
jgi:hypothetical protein